MEEDKIDDDSLSSESSDSDEDIDEEELKQEISIVRKQISFNHLDYDAHTKLISLLRKLGELDDLRQARSDMSKIYPLSPELWLDWLSDEQKISSTEDEHMQIVELFERAISDYTSVKIWVEYIMFMLGQGNHSKTREICEKALTAVGIHVSEGALVWQAVLLFEQQVFTILKDENDDKIEEQKKRIQSLYRRQSRVPLLNVDEEEFISEASPWFDNEIVPQMKKDLENTTQKLKEFLPLELQIIQAEDETSKLEAYRKYLDHVCQHENPALIQSIYERTLTDLCLNAGIWEEYVKFALEQFPFAEYVVLPLCERSQRNCPWSAELCAHHISAHQKFSEGKSKDELMQKIKACLEITIRSGLRDYNKLVKAWMAYLVFLRRNIVWDEENSTSLAHFRDSCEQAMDHIDQYCPATEDTECEIARYQAKIEATFAQNIEGARSIWNDSILKRSSNSKNSSLWLEFVSLERQYGGEKHARKLLRRALERVWDSVEVIGKAFQKFEQEVGTYETMEDFEKRYRDRLSIVLKKRMNDAAKEEAGGKSKQKAGMSPQKSRKDKQNAPPHKMDFNPNQNKAPKNEPQRFSGPSTSEFRKPLVPPPQHSSKNEVSPPPGYSKRPRRSSLEVVEEESPTKRQKVESVHGDLVKHDSSKDPVSVFLSNLDYSITREQIIPLFKDCGEIVDFRLVRDFKGRSKGFGYLEFKDISSVSKALSMDRTPVGTRPMFVSPCEASNRTKLFKFSSGLEKDKLFVRGLPQSMTEKDVKVFFEKFAPIKSIRLVTHRNGFSKGNCYVQFSDDVTAESVRQKTDGTFVDGGKLTVLISNPNASKEAPFSNTTGNVPTPGPSRPRGGMHQRLPFMPRSLMRKGTDSPRGANTSGKLNGENGKNGEGEESCDTQKSNQDFRKMFMK